MLVKKVNPEWRPAENPNLGVGEVTEVTNAEMILRQGLAVKYETKKVGTKGKRNNPKRKAEGPKVVKEDTESTIL